MRQNGRKKESGGVWAERIVSGILMILLVLCSVFGLILAIGNLIGRKTAGGFRCFTVLTDSMAPELNEGDLVIVGKTDADQIAEGDIIVFYPSQESDDYLIHLVTEKVDSYEGSGITCFYTSGANVKEEDGFLVDEERVVGTVAVIFPKLGYIARFLMVRWYCVVIYIALLFLMLRMLEFWLKYRKLETGASEREDKKHKECLTAEDKKREERLTAEDKKHEECLTAEDRKHEECLTAEDKKREERPTAEDKKHEESLTAENKKKEGHLIAKDKKRKDFLAYKKTACGLWISIATVLVAAVPVIYVASKDAVKEKMTQGEGLVCAESFALTSGGKRAEGRNIRAVNTGNRDAIVMAVLSNEISFQIYGENGTEKVTGEELVFDYSSVTSVGDGENTESYITAVYQGENLEDPSDDMVFHIYLNTVITYTDLTSVRKDYTEGDLEARDLFDVYQWTFDDASSTETEAYFYCNYIVTPGDHTGELIDRVELVSGADGATGFDYSLKFEFKNRQEVTPVGYLFGTANGIKGLGWSMEAENICGYYNTDCGRSNYIFWETA